MDASPYDTLQPVANQDVANKINVPFFVGLCLALLLSGVSVDRAWSASRRTSGKLAGVPHGRALLIMTMCANVFATCVTFWGCVIWGIDQDRSFAGINGYKVTDVIAIMAGAVVATLTQIFMAIRCWHILDKSVVFAVCIGLCILGSLAGASWLTAVTALFSSFDADDSPSFIASEVWLWCTVLTDLIILAALTRHFLKLRKGFNQQTDDFVTSLAVLAFETFLVPSFFVVTSAVIYAATWDSDLLWGISDAMIPALPSLYLLSFVACIRGSEARRQKQQGSLVAAVGSLSGESNGRVLIVKQPLSEPTYPSFALSAARSAQFISDTLPAAKQEEDVTASKANMRYSGISVMQHQARCVESEADDDKATEVYTATTPINQAVRVKQAYTTCNAR